MIKKRPINWIICLSFVFIPVKATSAEKKPETFFNGPTHFSNYEEPQLQINAWAVCAATYDISASIYGRDTATGKNLANMANGAEASIMMAQISGSVSEDMTVEVFNSNVTYGQTLMQSLPESAITTIMSRLELSDDKEALLETLGNTLKVCTEHSALQQSYIDMYREMITKGILTMPEEAPLEDMNK